MTTIKTSRRTITEEELTESIEVAPGVEVCRITLTRVDTAGELISSVEVVRSTPPLDIRKEGSLVIADPTLSKRLQQEGWFYDAALYTLRARLPFSHVVDGKPFEVLRVNHANDTLCDYTGQYLPVAMHFNYINGRTNNKCFDLSRLESHLKERGDISLRPVMEIPHYNREGGVGTHYLPFIWTPSIEDFRKYKAEIPKGTNRHNHVLSFIGADRFRTLYTPLYAQD